MANADYDLEAYRQANNDLRHFSLLRFSVLTAFVAISGGLFVLAVKGDIAKRSNFAAIALFAVSVAIAFMVLELRINAISEFYAGKVDDLAKELGMSPRACSAPPKAALGRWLAPLVMALAYGGAAIMWLSAWLA